MLINYYGHHTYFPRKREALASLDTKNKEKTVFIINIFTVDNLIL